jgi:hypothetical protein
MFYHIIANTPAWVWGLLLVLLALGFSQTRSRLVGSRRLVILPLVMTGLSLSGTVSSFGAAPTVLLAWIASACMVAWLVARRPAPPLSRYDSATGLYHLPGSWVPMALIMGIFAIKYAVGAALAMQPALAANAVFSTATGALYGMLGGVFIGRAGRYWRLGKQPASLSVA